MSDLPGRGSTQVGRGSFHGSTAQPAPVGPYAIARPLIYPPVELEAPNPSEGPNKSCARRSGRVCRDVLSDLLTAHGDAGDPRGRVVLFTFYDSFSSIQH